MLYFKVNGRNIPNQIVEKPNTIPQIKVEEYEIKPLEHHFKFTKEDIIKYTAEMTSEELFSIMFEQATDCLYRSPILKEAFITKTTTTANGDVLGVVQLYIAKPKIKP